MKKLHSYKKPILMGVGLLSSIITILILFTACDIGLGSIVNTEKPVINTAGDKRPGTFLKGSDNKIELDISNKLGFKIAEAWMDIDYKDKNGDPASKRIDVQQNPDTGEWFVNIDTTGMADGKIIGKVTATDESGNTTITPEMVYNVKNTPPQVKLSMPPVKGDDWDDDTYLDKLKNDNPLFIPLELVGMATDNYGIADGYPKIMIWPAEGIQLDDDGLPLESDSRYHTWYSLDVPKPKDQNAAMFSWRMVNLVEKAPGVWDLPENGGITLQPGKYRIRIVTKDLFGEENYYPNRTDTTRPSDEPSRKYIEINYIASQVPTIKVTDCPEYYNTVKDFEVFFTIGSTNPMTSPATDYKPVTAYIVNIDNEDRDPDKFQPAAEKKVGGPYYPVKLSDNGTTTYYYKLTVLASEAKAWTQLASKGVTFVRMVAKDGQNKESSVTYQQFFYDITPPEVVFDRPSILTNKLADNRPVEGGAYDILYPESNGKPKWQTGTVTIGGQANDNFFLKEVWYHIGRLGDDNSLTDSARAKIYTNPANWTNTNLDTTPTPPWSGFPYSFSYTFSFSKDVNYKTDPNWNGKIQELSNLNGYPNVVNYSDTEGRQRFYLPFYVKVVDKADNYRVVHYKLSIDPLLDEPFVDITQPSPYDEKGEKVTPIVGGTVRIAGSATDNFWMHTVLMRVKKDGGVYPVGTNYDGDYYLPPDTSKFYPNSSFPKPKPDGVQEDTDGWFEAKKSGDSSIINWAATINQDKALDPPNGITSVGVTIEVVAIDCNDTDLTHTIPKITGPVETLNVLFSTAVPKISDPVISKDKPAGVTEPPDVIWKEGTKASGKFKLTMDVVAIGHIKTLTARINNSKSTIPLVTNKNKNEHVNAVWTIGDETEPETNEFKRVISLTVDSVQNLITGLDGVSGYPYGKTGDFTLEIYVEDGSDKNLSSTRTFVIPIDNFYPTAVINTPHIATDNNKYYFVLGEALDNNAGSGTVQGLERVLVYFEKGKITHSNGVRTVTGNRKYIKPNGNDASTSDFIEYPNVLFNPSSASVVEPNTSIYEKFPKLVQKTINGQPVWTAENAMVIDKEESLSATQDADSDGTYGEDWNGPSARKEFGASVNFSGWKDGPYIVHYLVMDQAGNATHYQNDIYLENHKPRITSINFGTDINGVGNVTDGTGGTLNEYLYFNEETGVAENIPITAPGVSTSFANEMSPSFSIRNNSFSVKLNVEGGNGAKSVSVSYVTSEENKDASSMVRGEVYTISNTVGTTDFIKYGSPNNIPGTTFVATGPAAGTGKVIHYTSASGKKVLQPVVNTEATVNFTNFTGIDDSPKDSDGNITLTGKNQRLFIIKTSDTTITASGDTGNPDGEFDQLADAILVKLDIDNLDKKKPSITVLPFGKEYYVNAGATPPLNNPANDAAKHDRDISAADYTKNIFMDGNVKAGYVQYAKHNQPGSTDIANISGKVKFLGKAEDNQRIDSIWVKIDNYNGGQLFKIAHANAGNNGFIVGDNSSDDWKFNLLGDNYLTQDYGHTLNWEFMWDSSTVELSARENVSISFQVRDAANNSSNPSDSTITVNIVPYISEVVTPLSGAYASSPSAFSRSALGGYPVREGDSITIKGFNFKDVTVKLNDISIGGAVSNNGTTITSTIPTTATNTAVSGPLVVTVNNVDSFNNKSNKTASYNQEPNNVNNNILDNSRYLYVWRTGYLLNEAVITNPFFRMDPKTAARYITFGYYDSTQATNSGLMRIQINNGNGSTWNNTTTRGLQLNAVQNRYISTTVAIGSSGEIYAAASNQTQGGQPFIRYTTSALNSNTAPTVYRNTLATPSDPGRFNIPRLFAKNAGNGTVPRVLMSYYDNNDKNVYFHYGSRGSTSNDTWAGFTKRSVSTSGSHYTAVGALSDGRPLIAWYDGANNGSLRFNYGDAAAAGNAANNNYVDNPTWITNTILNPDGTNGVGNGRGAHVDLAVDDDDNVHLAYYDIANGGLYYLLIPSSFTYPNTNNSVTYRPVRVDTYLAVGTKIMLNVRKDGDNYVPYITYFHGSFAETRNSIRVAWQKRFPVANGTDANDRFTGAWEVMTVPAQNTPVSSEMICNGVPTAITNWQDTGLTKGSTDLTKSIVVGYMTNSYYEGALLKDDMTSGLPAK